MRYPEKLSVPLAQELVLSSGKPGFVPALKALLEYSYRERLAAIEIPVLIVWGRNDLLVPWGTRPRYQRLIGDNAHVEIFDDTGHVPMSSGPSRFNECCVAFLAGERRRSRTSRACAGGSRTRVIAPSEALRDELGVLGQHAAR